MTNRYKISPLVIIGICILIPCTIGTIVFTFQTPYCVSFNAICFYAVFFAPLGIFAGGVLLCLGILFSLKIKKKSKGIIQIVSGTLFFSFTLFLFLPMIIIYPTIRLYLIFSAIISLILPSLIIIFGAKNVLVNVKAKIIEK